MGTPACTITFEKGHTTVVVGTLEEVREQLSAGGLVQLQDPWGGPVTINAANVTKVEALPGDVEARSR